jgi:cytochrome c oxidase subunit 4
MNEPAKAASRKSLVFTWLGLLALTLVNTLIAFVNLGVWSALIALGITVIMAALIVAFWMHALYESKVVWIVVAGAVIWFLIFIVGTLDDYITRSWLPFPGK